MLCVKPCDDQGTVSNILNKCKIAGTEPRVLLCTEYGKTLGYIVVDKTGGILNIPSFSITDCKDYENPNKDDKEIAEYLIRAAGSYGLNRYILALETNNKEYYSIFKLLGFKEIDNKLSISLKLLFKKCENC